MITAEAVFPACSFLGGQLPDGKRACAKWNRATTAEACAVCPFRSMGKQPVRAAIGKGSKRPPSKLVPPLAVRLSLPCVHLGEPTGNDLVCAVCRDEDATTPEYACAKHGTCTWKKTAKGKKWCGSCKDYPNPNPEAPTDAQ